tara:strand:+ start:430 stop:681 length:252 start_codon:yes stop_codon:yes gene_type:complete
MKILKNIEDINFTTQNVYGSDMKVSEDIVMASAAGWYVGTVCKEFGFIQPFDRHTGYFKTSDEAQAILDSGEIPVCSVCDGIL